ncbi:MAG: glycosyltransferase family 87 protein [bacterium]|nr:glycosyltransferase family 87 protein [bacterium]
MMSARKTFSVIINTAIFILIALLAWRTGDSSDFKEYWGAFQLLQNGQNSYDPAQMLAVQQPLEPGLETPLMMWNPPWLPLVMSPALAFGYETGRLLWFIISLAMFCAAITLLRPQKGYLENMSGHPAAIYLLMLAIPVIECLRLGQLGFFLLFFEATTIYYAVKGRATLAGIFFAFLSAKPHIFLFFGLALLVTIGKKRLPSFFSAVVISLLLLWGTTIIIAPGSPHQWLTAINADYQTITPPALWKTSSLASAIREQASSLLGEFNLTTARRIIWLPPIAAGLFLMLAYRTLCLRYLLQVDKLHLWSCFSAAVAPFLWHFDFLILLPAIIFLAGEKRKLNTPQVAILLLAQPALIMSMHISGNFIGAWWFPWMLLALYVPTIKREKSRNQRANVSIANS